MRDGEDGVMVSTGLRVFLDLSFKFIHVVG